MAVGRGTIAAILVYSMAGVQAATAATVTDIHLFDGAKGGWNPSAGLLADSTGNLYGTTYYGGSTACGNSSGCGTVFELSPPAVGHTKWTYTVLLSFKGKNGTGPIGNLIADSAGNLYGTTSRGGRLTADCDGGLGCGTVFELSPPASGQSEWTQKVLLSFKPSGGESPAAGLIADSVGNFYGTTSVGGDTSCSGFGGCGVVFELTPPQAGQTNWTEKVLLTFERSDGLGPYGLLADSVGNLFGTTWAGGADGLGSVFELTPPQAGQTKWTETLIYSFAGIGGQDGAQPQAGLIADAEGNLFGTTALGGKSVKCGNDQGCGTAFEVSPPPAGQIKWSETVLTWFPVTKNDTGTAEPNAPLIFDNAGHLYGTTIDDVFKLKPPVAGQKNWIRVEVATLGPGQGYAPAGGLIADSAGNFYGTASAGGSYTNCQAGCGTVFKLKP